MLELLRKFRTQILVVGLILLALLVYSANLRRREQTTLFERVVLQLTAPLQKGIDVVADTVTNLGNRYLWLVHTERENERLKAENRRDKAELARLEEVRLANGRLRKLLGFKKTLHIPNLPAQVIGEDASNWFQTVVIDKGSADGLREGMPVVVPEGVAGRIIETAPHQARVLLITDASSAVAAMVQRTRARGIIRGQGETLSFDYALREDDIKVGDRIISSGTGGMFPKGLTIGVVTQITKGDYGLFQGVEVAPAVDFGRLEEVLVLLKGKQ
ncbi:MAG TPA: rod shape-determining protein MreC [Desulfuromonadales bacterium]|nr:rod shape-determining protein MreC [Desulfuromonadales bacterium]